MSKDLQQELYELVSQEHSVFDFIQEAALDGLWYWDMENPANVWVNPAFTKKTPFYPWEHNASPNLPKLLGKEQYNQFEKALRLYLNNKTGIFEYTFQFAKSPPLWMNARGLPILGSSDEASRMLLAFNDISKEKLLELELKDRVDRYEQVISNTGIGIWEWNLSNNHSRLNKEGAGILGYQLEELAPLPTGLFENYIHPDDLENAQKALKSHLDGKTPVYEAELRMRHKLGHWIWVLDKGKVISRNEDNIVEWIRGSWQDISARKEIESKQEVRIQRYKTFVENAPTANAMFDRKMKYLAASDKWCEDYKLQRENIIGKSHYEVFPEIGSEWKEIHKACLKGEIMSRREDPFHRANGSVQWIRWEVRPWYNLENEIGGLLMYSEEISEIKEKEALLNTYSAVLDRVNVSANIGIWEINFENDHIFWSDAFRRIHGVSKTYKPSFSYIEDFIRTEEHREKLKEAFQKTLNGENCDLNVQIIPKNSTEPRWVRVVSSPIMEDNECVKMFGLFQDIQDQKFEKEEFQKAHRLLESAAKALTIGTWEVDLTSMDVFWSDVTKKIHEVPLDYHGKVEAGINFYKEGENRKRIDEILTKAINQGIPYDEEFELVTAKGREIWVRTMGIPVMKEGKCERIYGLFMDITEAKQIRETLESKERRFRGIFNSTYQFIGFLNPEGRLLEANETALKFSGMKEEEYLNTFFWEADWWKYAEHAKQNVKEAIDRAAKGELVKYKTKAKRADGELIPIDFNLKPIFDKEGNVTSLIAEGRPIQEIESTQRELERALNNLQNVLDASTEVIICEAGLDGLITQFNKGAQCILGYSAEEVLNKLSPIQFHLKEEVEEFANQIYEKEGVKISGLEAVLYYARKEGHDTRTWTFEKKNGDHFSAQLSITSVKDANGELKGFLGVATDISAEVSAREEIQSLLDVTRHQNEQLLNFAHIVSHNLRSHSGNIEMLIDLLRRQHPELDKIDLFPLLKKASSNLTETIFHLNEMVASNNKPDRQLQDIKVRNYVEQAIENLSAKTAIEECQIENEIPEDLHIKGIPAYVESIFLNLISNSLKYRHPKRVLKVEISSEIRDSRVCISVSDNGLGIDLTRHRAKLFGMYKTFHNHKDARGIGLFITKNQVEAMNGTIEVESEVGIGTSFVLCFPNE